MKTLYHLTETEAREILSELDLDFDSPDNETHDRHGIVSSWGRDGETVYMFYANGEGEYSITSTEK